MKYRSILLILAVPAFLLSGCATMQLSKNIIDFTITPETGIRSGTIVTVNVKTTDDVAQVMGFLDMFGSYKIPLKYDTTQKFWYYKAMVPMGIVIPPGDYLTKVEAVTKSGGHYYAEKKIVIK